MPLQTKQRLLISNHWSWDKDKGICQRGKYKLGSKCALLSRDSEIKVIYFFNPDNLRRGEME